MSYLVLPRPLLTRYRQLFQDYFATVSLLEQRTLAKFMEQGHWDRHVRRMRTIYEKKHDTLLRAIAHHFGTRAVIVGQGAGLHVVLQLSGTSLGETEIIDRAEREGIRLFPFSSTCVSSEPNATKLMLGFGGMTASEIEQGIPLLSQLCF